MIHILDIKKNEFGTPFVNDVFEQGEEKASHETLCYLNADIILLSEFIPAVENLKKHLNTFLMIGQRWDLNITHELNFSDNEWEKDLREQVAGSGSAHMTRGIDYFVFKRGLWKKIPPFAIGRTAWDNWLVYQPLLEGKSVVDASQVVTAVHQDHDYGHVQGGKQGTWNGVEAQRNQKLAGKLVVRNMKGDIKQADWRLTPSGLKKNATFYPVSRSSLFFKPEKSEFYYPQIDSGLLADTSCHKKTGLSKKDKEKLKPCLARVGWQEKEILYNSHFEWVMDLNYVKSPRVSVVVTSWRFDPDTLENFQSLDAQRHHDFELIFVNNGAPEDEFRDLMPYIDVYVKLNKNTGAYLSRNIGAIFAKAPVIIFLDDDGIPEADFVKAHLEAFDAYDIIAARGVCNPKTDNPRNRFAMHYYLGNRPFPRLEFSRWSYTKTRWNF